MRLTLYQAHKQKWKDGCNSDSCDHATRRVFARGMIPCDVLILGQSPGRSEDVHGKPFIGPAGNMMDYIIEKSIPSHIRYALTNVVCCMPISTEEGGDKKAHDPSEEQLQACKPRLEEFLRICSPRIIVCVGKIVKEWMEQGYLHSVQLPKVKSKKPILINILHPSYIMQSPIAGQTLLIDDCVIAIEDAIEKYLKE